MSLRTDIHSAIDVIAPPVIGMPERVVHHVQAEHVGRERRTSMGHVWRATLALVAAALVVTVTIVSVNAWKASHSGATPATHVTQVTVPQLEARKLNLAVIGADAPCPVTAHIGSVDVNVAGSAWSDDAGRYWDLAAVTPESGTGPVVVRGRDLRTGRDMYFVGSWAHGPAVGTDVWDGATVTFHSELLLDPNHPTHESAGPGMSKWTFTAGTPPGGPAWCLGLQLDGANFSQTVVLAR